MKRNVCVITGTRADYGLLRPVMRRIEASPNLRLQLVATTMHSAPQFGLTLRQIEADGFRVDEVVENLLAADTASAVAKSTGLATMMLADVYKRLQPDVVLLLGDRFEALAAATTALLMHIPIAHIHGGETTEGAVDEQIRHAISKMSQLHFVAAEPFKERLVRMGESPDRVFVTGAPGLDNLAEIDWIEKEELERELNWQFGEKSALFTYHPETHNVEKTQEQIEAILKQLETNDLHVLFTYANADEGGQIINRAIDRFCRKDPVRFKAVANLGQRGYLSAMHLVDVVIGNSSSGIIEAASLRKPVVNIGDRQKGRLRNDNVIDCDVENLEETIRKALSESFIKVCLEVTNRYGDGMAAERIIQVLESVDLRTKKSFYESEVKK